MLKASLVSIWSLVIPICCSAHDIKAALFRLYEEDGAYRLEIRLDKEDIETALNIGCSLEFANLTHSDKRTAIEDYLKSNLIVGLNGTEGRYAIKSFSQEEEYLIIHAVFDGTDIEQNLSKIEVVNTCLLETVEGHDNIILSHVNGQVRSFRLNQKLQSTTIKY